MNTRIIFALLTSTLIMQNAIATDPVYSGENGILEQIFAPKCLACHSSTLSGSERNGAPFLFNYDTYSEAVKTASAAVLHTVIIKDMPELFNGITPLNAEQRQAMSNWKNLGFPERDLPPIFLESTATLSVPKVYIMNSNGDIASDKVSTKMILINSQAPFRFEISELKPVNEGLE